VTRRADPDDRRSTLVGLTPAGRRLLDQLDTARNESAVRVFGVLTELQRDQLLALLQAICNSDECSSGSAATPAIGSVANVIAR
jgi:DNA-binding MarR family transcriptional regulator